MDPKVEKTKEGDVQHVVRISHLPYGFFEKEMHGYFSQFGKIKRVRVRRNRKGNHTGVAFVEFKEGEVAKIAAQTMDNYLLAEERLRCRVLGQEEVPRTIQKGRLFAKIVKPGENRIRHAKEHFSSKTPEQEAKQRERFVANLRKRMAKIKEMGINYEFEFEEKLRNSLNEGGTKCGIGKEDFDIKLTRSDLDVPMPST